MPRSPCSESTGCRNIAGVPVDVKVAAILRAMSPDFPTPETITRPLAAASSSTARANGALPRLLDRVRSIKDDRRLAGLLQPRKTPHIDDQIAIAEEGAALRHSHFRCSPSAHLLDGAAHLLRRHPLALLDVHGA